MEAPQVDFSAIRGDWYFHMRFITNAMTRTLERASRMWADVGADLNADELGRLVQAQHEHWSALTADPDDKGALKTADPAYQAFIDLCRSTKAPCDALEEAHGAGGSSSSYDSPLEQFTESCRQARGLCDDLEMMREQRPDA